MQAITFMSLDSVEPEVSNRCVAEVVLALRENYFPASEQIIYYGEKAERMYLVRTGLVGVNGRVKRENTCFGEDIIVGVRREYMATTLTFCCVLALDKDDLLKIIEQGVYDKILASAMSKARWMRIKCVAFRFPLSSVSRARFSLSLCLSLSLSALFRCRIAFHRTARGRRRF